MSLAACGDDADEPRRGGDDTTSSPRLPADDEAEDAGRRGRRRRDLRRRLRRHPDLRARARSTAWSTDPVATAASNNPLLTTLVTAIGAVPGLADTLNGAEALTVFAPTNDAFAKIPEADLNAVLADKATLTAILSHHVVGENLDPEAVVGEHETLNRDTITVEGDTEAGMTVDGGAANVICGNIPTANATVYVIDSVLMPTA